MTPLNNDEKNIIKEIIKEHRNDLSNYSFEKIFSDKKINLQDLQLLYVFLLNMPNPVNILEYVKTIPTDLFSYVNDYFPTYIKEGMKKITIPKNIKKLDAYQFYGNKVVEDIKLPDSIESLGVYCFGECRNLKTISLPQTANLKELPEGCFYNDESLTRVEIPDKVDTVQARCFSGCDNIKICYSRRKNTGLPMITWYGGESYFEFVKKHRELK